MLKPLALAVLILMLLGGMYLFANREPIGEALASSPYDNPDLAAMERAFQREPEKEPAPGAQKIPIFIYHSVRPHFSWESKIQDQYDITPELFEKQLIYLRDNGFTAITLDDLADDVEKGTTTPVAKPVVLTFDDGWGNQYKYAFPLLVKYNMIAAFYVYTNPIGKGSFLTWNQIHEMDAAGMTIASHTLSHPYLKKLSAAEIKREIGESKKILEAELKKPVWHFASPYGYTSPDVVAAIKEAGYKTGRTVYYGIYHAKEDLLKLRGVSITDDFDDFVRPLSR